MFICIILILIIIEQSEANLNSIMARSPHDLIKMIPKETRNTEYSKRTVEVGGRRYKREVFGPTTGNIIKIGRTYAQSGAEVPYSTSQDAYLQMLFNYINNVLGGIMINGVKYTVTLHWNI